MAKQSSVASILFSVMAVKTATLNKLIDQELAKLLPSGQSINDNGLASASYKLVDKRKTTDFIVQLKTKASAGLKLSADELATELAGLPSGDARQKILAKPGVTSAEIKISPSFVSNLPKKEKN